MSSSPLRYSSPISTKKRLPVDFTVDQGGGTTPLALFPNHSSSDSRDTACCVLRRVPDTDLIFVWKLYFRPIVKILYSDKNTVTCLWHSTSTNNSIELAYLPLGDDGQMVKPFIAQIEHAELNYMDK